MPMHMHVSKVTRPPTATTEFWGPRGVSETQVGMGTLGIFITSPKGDHNPWEELGRKLKIEKTK